MTIQSTSLKTIVSQLGHVLREQVFTKNAYVNKLIRTMKTGDFYSRADAMMKLRFYRRGSTSAALWKAIAPPLKKAATHGKNKCIRMIASRSLYAMGSGNSVPSAIKQRIWYYNQARQYFLRASNIRIAKSPVMACYYKFFRACLKKYSTKPKKCTSDWFYYQLNARQGQGVLRLMRRMALSRSVQKKHIPMFQFHLRNYMQSNANFLQGRARRGLIRLRKALRGIGIKRRGSLTRKRLRHLVHLAYLAAYYGEKAWGKSSDRQVLRAYRTLQGAVFRDGKSDPVERRTLSMVNQNIHGFHPLGGRGELIENLLLGFRMPKSRSKPLHFKPLPHRAYLNIGTNRLFANRAKRFPKGYRKLKKTDPRLKGRPTYLECYSFALSQPISFSPSSIMNRSYRRLDLSKERARKGDIVVYFSLQSDYFPSSTPKRTSVIHPGFNLHHAGVITSINAKGFPTRAMGQFGIRQPIFEHPVAQATLIYGAYWIVLRKKPVKKP